MQGSTKTLQHNNGVTMQTVMYQVHNKAHIHALFRFSQIFLLFSTSKDLVYLINFFIDIMQYNFFFLNFSIYMYMCINKFLFEYTVCLLLCKLLPTFPTKPNVLSALLFSTYVFVLLNSHPHSASLLTSCLIALGIPACNSHMDN